MIRVVASMEKKMSVQKATVKELLMQIATLKKKKTENSSVITVSPHKLERNELKEKSRIVGKKRIYIEIDKEKHFQNMEMENLAN